MDFRKIEIMEYLKIDVDQTINRCINSLLWTLKILFNQTYK